MKQIVALLFLAAIFASALAAPAANGHQGAAVDTEKAAEDRHDLVGADSFLYGPGLGYGWGYGYGAPWYGGGFYRGHPGFYGGYGYGRFGYGFDHGYGFGHGW